MWSNEQKGKIYGGPKMISKVRLSLAVVASVSLLAVFYIFSLDQTFIHEGLSPLAHHTPRQDQAPYYPKPTLSEGGSDVTNDKECVLDRKFMPKRSMPLILLLSFPGSGNTWVRYLLERSTGIYSGSAFIDEGTGDDENSTFRKSYPCSGTTVVIKSHGWSIKWGRVFQPLRKKCKYEGVIFLVRNPYYAILAEYNRRRSGKTGAASASDFIGGRWKNFVKEKARQWVDLLDGPVKDSNNLLFVFYEDLVADTENELCRMLEFLGIPRNDTRIGCLLRKSSGNFKRKHRDVHFNPFTATLNETVDACIRKAKDIMKVTYGINLPNYESTASILMDPIHNSTDFISRP